MNDMSYLECNIGSTTSSIVWGMKQIKKERKMRENVTVSLFSLF